MENNDSVLISLRLPAYLFSEVKRAGQLSERTLSQEIRFTLARNYPGASAEQRKDQR